MHEKRYLLSEISHQRQLLDELIAHLLSKEALSSTDYEMCGAATAEVEKRMRSLRDFSVSEMVRETLWTADGNF